MNLSIEELQNFKLLLNITHQILDTYNDLMYLESENKKDTEEYKMAFKILVDLLIKENEYYESIKENEFLINELSFLINQYEDYSWSDALKGVKIGSDKYLVKQRVNAKLNFLINTFVSDDEEDESELDEEFNNLYLFDYQVSLNYLRTVLKILSLYMKDEKYQNIKDYLICYKYRLAFSFSHLEDEFIKNDFQISETLFWYYLQIDDEDLNMDEISVLQDQMMNEVLYGEMDDLLEVYNEEVDKEVWFRTIIAQILTRAGLLLLSDKERYNYLNTLNMAVFNVMGTNEEADEVVHGAVNNIQNDKNLVHFISGRGRD